jgi:uncharacterized protein YecE (DUF72 family)
MPPPKAEQTVWCFFDSDQNGYAARDALRLHRLLDRRRPGAPYSAAVPIGVPP